MNPEQLETCAKRAYEIFAANVKDAAPWSAVVNKASWRDAVTAHHLNPAAIGRSPDPNLQERCVQQAYSELYTPAAEQPLVIPAVDAPEVEAPPEGDDKPKRSRTK
jgi:hypothetical protein